MYKIYNQSCMGLPHNQDDSIDALVTDPPYGIKFQGHDWDKALPNKEIWADSYRVLKPGAFGLVFSSVRLMHRLMVDLEDTGFIIRDVLFWANLNGMPKSRNVGLDIDKELDVASEEVGEYKYVQGYKKGGAPDYYAKNNKKILKPASEIGKKYDGAGHALKPIYEPIILIQKPLDKVCSVAQNIIKHGVGALNLEETRIPYSADDGKVGHNPHPLGRIASNVLRTDPFEDGYDKFFLVPKVRQSKEDFNTHPTIKPVLLMEHIIKLTSFEGHTVLDPFMGSGSTGVACMNYNRNFVGYELDNEYYQISEKRLKKSLTAEKQHALL